MFNLAIKWQLFEGRNPAASPGMLREQHRDRFLTAAETQALVRALDAEPSRDSAAALALLILTGARKQEVLRARWEFVDLDRAMLTLPLSKSGHMGSFSIWHWLVVMFVVVVLYGIPMAMIIGRTGRSRWWVLAFFIPIINIAALWVLALVRWPAISDAA
jgi:integrase